MQAFGCPGHLFPDHCGQIHPGQGVCENNSQAQPFYKLHFIYFKSRLRINFLNGYSDYRDLLQAGVASPFLISDTYEDARHCPPVWVRITAVFSGS